MAKKVAVAIILCAGIFLTTSLDWAANNTKASFGLGETQTASYYNEGVIAQKAGKFEEADIAYDKVLLIVPGKNKRFYEKKILNNCAAMYLAQGKLDQAEATLKELLILSPNYKNALLNLGLVYDRKDDKIKALEYWMSVFNLESIKFNKPRFTKKAPIPLINKSAAGEEESVSAGATEVNERISSPKKEFMKYYYNNEAVAAFKNNDSVLAEEKLKQSLGVDPKYRVAGLNLAYLYEMQGDKLKSLEARASVLGLDELKPKEPVIEDTVPVENKVEFGGVKLGS